MSNKGSHKRRSSSPARCTERAKSVNVTDSLGYHDAPVSPPSQENTKRLVDNIWKSNMPAQSLPQFQGQVLDFDETMRGGAEAAAKRPAQLRAADGTPVQIDSSGASLAVEGGWQMIQRILDKDWLNDNSLEGMTRLLTSVYPDLAVAEGYPGYLPRLAGKEQKALPRFHSLIDPDKPQRFLFCTVVRSKHWTASVYDVKTREVFMFDSFHRERHADALFQDMKRGWAAFGPEFQPYRPLRGHMLLVPTQMDGWSCGVRVLDFFYNLLYRPDRVRQGMATENSEDALRAVWVDRIGRICGLRMSPAVRVVVSACKQAVEVRRKVSPDDDSDVVSLHSLNIGHSSKARDKAAAMPGPSTASITQSDSSSVSEPKGRPGPSGRLPPKGVSPGTSLQGAAGRPAMLCSARMAATQTLSRAALNPPPAAIPRQLRSGGWDTCFKWPGDTYEDLARRPVPVAFEGFAGWDKLDRERREAEKQVKVEKGRKG